jgi:hypothetical protein
MSKKHPRPSDDGGSTPPAPTPGPAASGAPGFAQPVYTPDPTAFITDHPSDNAAYKIIDELTKENKIKPLAFPSARGGSEPVLTLAQTLGSSGAAAEAAITAAGQIVFHSVGDTGNTGSVTPQNDVSDKMMADFEDELARDVPQFFFHLGDVVYNFGEAQYYYDQFYDPYRNYPKPILALAGNHDGMISPLTPSAVTLDAFLRNFCNTEFVLTPESGGLDRTSQIQPGVYFTFQAPFVRIVAIYSNTLEDPGVISSENGTYPELSDVQLAYLKAALARVKSENYAGALILAHHHPAYTAGNKHGWSTAMLAQIDAICNAAGVWPHAVLSAHAHNYQRFSRDHGGRNTPYIIAGNGGHNVTRLTTKSEGTLRTPMVIQDDTADTVTLENYDDQNYGYLRILVNATQLRIEYHPASDGSDQKTPDDSVTIDLASRTQVNYKPTAAPAGGNGPSTVVKHPRKTRHHRT